MEKKVKTINTSYVVKVNDEVIGIEQTLKKARNLIKGLIIHNDNTMVQIVKQSTTEAIIDSYETKTARVLVASELGNDIEF